jgi:bifunctional enzyme CysN/CysC
MLYRSKANGMLKTVGGTVWLTGLPAAGKSTIAKVLQDLLLERGVGSYLLDGDDLREGLNADLGFTERDRSENVRRLGEIAILLARLGHLAIVSAISPYAASRNAVRERHLVMGVTFVEVYVATPLDVCESRDPKGQYAQARRGELQSFTGVSDPYQPPRSPELKLSTEGTPELATLEVLRIMEVAALLRRDTHE